jgi:hypothetical protein
MRIITYFAYAIIGSLLIGSIIAPPVSLDLSFAWGWFTPQMVDRLLK